MPHTLEYLIKNIKCISITGNTHQPIANITFDSRKVQAETLFVAIKGTANDGHAFIPSAIEKGATAIVCEQATDLADKHPQVCFVVVQDSSVALGQLASAFYDFPSHKLKIVAVTGTNGKTTNVTLLYQLFQSLGYKVGMLSTVQNWVDKTPYEATHTTPDPIQINQLMHQMVQQGCTHCFMEASSHAIHQNRMAGLSLTGAVFTNITHDHLDYHGTFDNYIAAKKKLFDDLSSSAFALVNVDDKRGSVMVQNTKATIHTFALKNMAEFKARMLSNSLHGLELSINHQNVWFQLIGEFNAYNLLGVYAVAVLLGENEQKVLTHLSALKGAKGRFETVISNQGVIGIVDYAHTPDALENVLKTITELRTRNEKVITIVGCGGNRDAAKRPVMAKIATHYSDIVVLTSDNPRFEDPEEILKQMQSGVPGQHFKKTHTITDRREAISFANGLAHKGDIILLAGKGHEDYQEIAGVKHRFDDREELVKAFNQ